MSTVGVQLREHRRKLGLSQAKLAEMSGVSQHRLSAFELDKANLPATLLDAVSRALADKAKVTKLATRIKRYRKHKYVEVQRLADRAARAARTPGNVEYCRILEEISGLHAREKNCNLSALSLFSGCGGFSLGFSAAGFLLKGFLELDPNLRNIYKRNFPGCLELGGDITEIDQESLPRFSEKLGTITAIIGGPPCQGFSLSGKRRVDDPRNTLFRNYLRFVDVIRPKVAI